MKSELVVNGKAVVVEGHPMDRLLDILREELDLIGTKEGCGEGECGACTVLMNGEPVLSCLVPRIQCDSATIETVEGLAAGNSGSFLESFVSDGGVQCGACTPGIIVTAWALLRDNPHPSRQEVQEALAGNLCRCTGYEGIHRAFERGEGGE